MIYAAYKKKYAKERKEWLKAHSFCVHCGKEKAEEGKTLCAACLATNRERSKRWRNNLTQEQKEAYRQKKKAYYIRRALHGASGA